MDKQMTAALARLDKVGRKVWADAVKAHSLVGEYGATTASASSVTVHAATPAGRLLLTITKRNVSLSVHVGPTGDVLAHAMRSDLAGAVADLRNRLAPDTSAALFSVSA